MADALDWGRGEFIEVGWLQDNFDANDDGGQCVGVCSSACLTKAGFFTALVHS